MATERRRADRKDKSQIRLERRRSCCIHSKIQEQVAAKDNMRCLTQASIWILECISFDSGNQYEMVPVMPS
jgi:hypothetical protein